MIGLDWRSAPVRRRKRHFVETIVPESLVQNKVTISLLVWRCSSLEPPASSSRNTAAVAEIQVALFRTIPYFRNRKQHTSEAHQRRPSHSGGLVCTVCTIQYVFPTSGRSRSLIPASRVLYLDFLSAHWSSVKSLISLKLTGLFSFNFRKT